MTEMLGPAPVSPPAYVSHQNRWTRSLSGRTSEPRRWLSGLARYWPRALIGIATVITLFWVGFLVRLSFLMFTALI